MSYAATEDPILAKHSLLRIIETNGEGGNQPYNYTSNINITTKGLKIIVRLCIIHEHAIMNHRCKPIQN